MPIFGVLMIAFRVLLLANPLAGAVILPWMYRVLLVLGEIVSLIAGNKMRSQERFSHSG